MSAAARKDLAEVTGVLAAEAPKGAAADPFEDELAPKAREKQNARKAKKHARSASG